MLRAGRLLTLLAFALAARLAAAYQDVELVPGRRYQASEMRPVHNLVRKYMRYSTAASSFVDIAHGWTSCGLACNSPDVQDVALNLTWHVDVPLSDGLIGIHTRDKEIVVAWAGTHRYRALLTDMSVLTVPYMSTGGSVHSGFLESVLGAGRVVESHLRRLMIDYPDYMVVFTGHSKGGAEAALSALHLTRRIDGLKQRVRVWTFGEPRLGDTHFANIYNKELGAVTYRVTSAADPVVAMPPRFLFDYCHHNLEIWISNAEGDIYVGQKYAECAEDPRASSSVDFYDRSIMWHKNYLGLPPPDHADAEFSW